MEVSSGSSALSVTTANGSGAHSITCPIVLNSSLLMSHSSSANFTASGIISGSGGITKTGTGTGAFVLSAANTYSGTTSINTGNITYSANGSIPSGSVVTIGDGTAPVARLTIATSMTAGNNFPATINSNGTLAQNSNITTFLSSLSGSGNIILSTGTGNTSLFQVSLSSDTNYSGIISGGATSTSLDPAVGNRINKTGTSTLTLTGASTYTSRTFIENGVINVQSNGGLGVAGTNSGVFVRATGTVGSLFLENNITLPKRILLNGSGFSGNGALRNVSGSNSITGAVVIGWSGGTESASNATIHVVPSTSLDVSGVISGANTLSKTGTGSLTFSGTTANTLTGTVIVDDGTLNLNKTSGINAIAGNATINAGGTLALSVANVISNTSIVTLNGGVFNLNSNTDTIGSLVFNSGTFTQGGATLTVANATPTALSLSDGVVISGPITYSSTGGLTYTGTTTTATITGNLSLGTSAHVFNIADGSNSTDLEISGVISGTGSITKSTGAGTLEYSGNLPNTYTGLTTINAGELLLNKPSDIMAIAGNCVMNAGGTLTLSASNPFATTSQLTISGGSVSLAGNNTTINVLNFTSGSLSQGGATLTINGNTNPLTMGSTTITGNIAFTGTGAINFNGATSRATISGNVNLGSNTRIINLTNGIDSIDMDISGVISGTGGLTKSTGIGDLRFSGSTANTYTGLTTINTGTLNLNKTSGIAAIAGNVTVNVGGTLSLDQADQFVNTSLVTLSGGTFNMNGNNSSLGSFTYTSGTFTQGGATLSLLSNATALTMGGTTIAGNLSLLGTGLISFNGASTAATISGDIDLGSNTHTFSITNGTPNPDMILSGVITGTGGITKIGTSSVLQISGASPNTYTGSTTITSGSLLLNKTAGITAVSGDIIISGGTLQLGALGQIATTSTVSLSSGTWNLSGFDTTIARLTFSGGTYTPSGATLTLANNSVALSMAATTISGAVILSGDGDVLFTGSSGTATVSGTIDLGGNTHDFDINNGSTTTDMLLSNVISNGALSKSGAGRLSFSGALNNTYTGLTTISAGTLHVNKTPTIDAIAGDVLVNGGILLYGGSNQIADTSTVTVDSGSFSMGSFSDTIATLILNGGSATIGTLTLSSNTNALTMRDTTLSSGTLILSGSGSVDFDDTNDGTATIASALNLSTSIHDFNIANGSSDIDMALSGIISGTGGITKLLEGTLELRGSSSNTFTGLTTITNGDLQLNKNTSIAAIAGDILINGGTLSMAANNQIANTSSLTIDSGLFTMNSQTDTINDLIVNGGSATLGTLTLASNATALTMRDTTLSSGTLVLSGSGSVTFDDTNDGIATIASNLDLSSSSHDFNIADGLASIDMTISGVISGAGGITKLLGGTLELSGSSSNTYSGITTVSNGELQLNKSTSVDAIAGDILINGGVLSLSADDQIADTSTLTIESGSFTMNSQIDTINNIIINGGSATLGTLTLASNATALTMRDTTLSSGTLILSGSGSIIFDNTNNGTATIGSNLDLSSSIHDLNIGNGTALVDMSISGVISGSGGITKLFTGTLELSGSTANTFTGLTTVSSGELQLNKSVSVDAIAGDILIDGGTLSLSADDQIADTSTLTVDSGSFSMNSQTDTINEFIFNGGAVSIGTLSLSSNATALIMRDTTIAGGTIILTGSGSVAFDNSNNGMATIGNDFDLSSSIHDFNIANGSSSVDMTVSGIISGSGGITKLLEGTLEFSGPDSNTFSGLTTVSDGELQLNKSASMDAIAGDILISGGILSLSADDQIADTSTLTIDSGSFDMNSQTDTINDFIVNGGSATLGTLTLTSNATALTVRDTIISGGTIILSGSGSINFDDTNNGSATLGSDLDLSASTHDFNIANGSSSVDMSISSVISGTGGITKLLGGTLELSGSSSNTFTGLTTVSDGELQLNKSASLNAIAGDILIDGGILSLSTNNQIADTSTLTISSGSFSMGLQNESIDRLIFNGGTIQQSSSTLTLLSAATALTMRDTTLSGDVTIINGGDVVFDDANGGTANLEGQLSLSLPTTFSIPNGIETIDMEISGSLIGPASIDKIGLGTLSIIGTASYTGGTTISAGILQGNTNGIQGSISNESQLIFDQSFSGTFNGSITAIVGTLAKQGTGLVNLINTNTIGGLTTISEGTLAVNGLLDGVGDLTVASLGNLQGEGTISKDVTIFGSLSPGNSIGTIHLIGDQVFAAGSTLINELNSTISDLVDITGSLSILAGSNLELLLEPSNYEAPFSVKLVQTTTGITGTFTNVNASLPLFDGNVVYSPNAITLQGDFVPVFTLVNTGNAGAVAKCIQDLPKPIGSDLLFIVNELRNIPTEKQLENAVIQMQPSALTALSISLQNQLFYLKNAIYNHLEDDQNLCHNNESNWKLWGSVFSGFSNQDNKNKEPGFHDASPGVVLGFDYKKYQPLLLGGGVGYTYDKLKWNQSRGNAEINSIYAHAYARIHKSIFALEGAILGGYNFYQINRKIKFTGFSTVDRTAAGSPQGEEVAVNLKGEFILKNKNVEITPFGGITYTFLHRHSYKESGAKSLNLTISGYNASLLSTEGGIKIANTFCQKNQSFKPFIVLGVARENRHLGEKQRARIEGCPFEVKGLNPTRTLFTTSCGLNYSKYDFLQISAYYNGRYGSDFYDNSISLQLIKPF